MILRQIAWFFGLTFERKKELSDIIHEVGEVTSKHYEEDGLAVGLLGLAEEFKISFSGQNVSFNLDDKQLFKTFEVGDKVRLAYREQRELTYNYVLPNFDGKQLVNSTLLERRQFVSAEKIE